MNEELRAELEALFAKAPERSLGEVLFQLARAYSETADTASSEARTTGRDMFLAPAIVCKAFALELLLKFFIVAGHPEVRTIEDADRAKLDLRDHPYSVLFDRVPSHLQQMLADSMSIVSGSKTDVVSLRRLLKRGLGEKPFVSWRYIYERTGIRVFRADLLDLTVMAFGKSAEAELRRILEDAAKGGPP